MIESHIIIDKARYKTCIGFNITEFLADMHIITKSNKFIISSNPNILSFKSSKSEMGKDIPKQSLNSVCYCDSGKKYKNVV